ncbi:hypothetical protein CVT26_009731 [Gymnopilus dilepis]|uniref:Uncharacterized protein n=1 Tax=Gymnopilus dilepis TaxID=231916 RepID=A0A409WCS8_9AGAR|nr:hypothetical protein CVT26_009731 [Gymnopilus dilepis]
MSCVRNSKADRTRAVVNMRAYTQQGGEEELTFKANTRTFLGPGSSLLLRGTTAPGPTTAHQRRAL